MPDQQEQQLYDLGPLTADELMTISVLVTMSLMILVKNQPKAFLYAMVLAPATINTLGPDGMEALLGRVEKLTRAIVERQEAT